MERSYLIEPCCGLSIDVNKGQKIIVTDIEGGQVVDFFAEIKNDPDEFISTGVTIDCNMSLQLHTGDRIYSNLYKPMFKVIYDDVGKHDLLHPCCRPEMYDFFYHNGAGHPNCLDNINKSLNEKRPIITPVNIFMNTQVDTDGRITVKKPLSKAGDKIILQAERDVRIGVAACSVSESDCNGKECTAIRILITDRIP